MLNGQSARCYLPSETEELKMRNKKYYTVYSDKKDEIVAFGSSAQCCKTLGYKDIEQFYSFVSKTRSGLIKHYTVVVEKVEEDETF